MTAHPLLTEQPQWQALDRQEQHLKDEHRAAGVRLERKAAGARTAADRAECRASLTDAAWTHQHALEQARARRAEWLRVNADGLAALCLERDTALLVEAGRLVGGFTADAGPVRGLADIAQEATALRALYAQVVALTDRGRPVQAQEVTPTALLEVVMAGVGLLAEALPGPAPLATVRPSVALALADGQPAAILAGPTAPAPAAEPVTYDLQRVLPDYSAPAEVVEPEPATP